MTIQKNQMTAHQIGIVEKTTEHQAFYWMYIEIIERDVVARKCEIMDEVTERLLPIRHLLTESMPFDPTSEKSLKDYRHRSEYPAQKLDKDCGRGKNWITRQTDGVNGRLSFLPGGAEAAKADSRYQEDGLPFLQVLADLTNPEVRVRIRLPGGRE